MIVLVTGGSGYIGSHTCVQLLQAGHTPVILDNQCNSKASVLDRIATLTGTRPRLYQGMFAIGRCSSASLPSRPSTP